MKRARLNIGVTPGLLFGESSEKVFLFVHGLNGHKGEALAFAKVAVPKGYQVLGIDLPVDRKPWEVLPLLNEVVDYLFQHWQKVSVRANSIGSWFSLLAFQDRKVEQALFVSPLLDMKEFIEGMPSREEDYYLWVVEHPMINWSSPTFILRPEKDLVVSDSCSRDFIEQHPCEVIIMKNGEHWFHTPEQVKFMESWEKDVLY